MTENMENDQRVKKKAQYIEAVLRLWGILGSRKMWNMWKNSFENIEEQIEAYECLLLLLKT